MLCALSVAVSCSVSWGLRSIGSAMTDPDRHADAVQDTALQEQTDDPAEQIAAPPDVQDADIAEPPDSIPDAETGADDTAGNAMPAAKPPPDAEETARRIFSGVSESGIAVQADAAPDVFPADAVMRISDLSHDAAYLAANSLHPDDVIQDAVGVDISFADADGSELEPPAHAAVHVQITLPDALTLSGGAYTLLHLTDEGDLTPVSEAKLTKYSAEFETDAFSMFILTASGSYAEKDQAITVNGQAVPNSADHPYIVGLGETFSIRTRAPAYSNGSNENGYPYGADASVLAEDRQPDENTEMENGIAYRICEQEYTAVKAGSTSILLVVGEDWETEEFFVTVEPCIHVKLPAGECRAIPSQRNAFYPEGTGGEEKEFYLNTGDMLEVSYYSDRPLDGYDFGAFSENVLEKIGETTVSYDGRLGKYTQLFQAKAAGSDTVIFGYKPLAYIADQIKITVAEPPAPVLYLNTAIGEQQIDYLHEYLSIHAGYVQSYPQYFIYDERDNPQYIKNGDIQYGPNEWDYDRAFLPYRISSGDVIELSAYCDPDEQAALDFEVAAKGSHTDLSGLTKISDTVRETVSSGEHAGKIRLSAKFQANGSGTEIRTGVKLGSSYFYVAITEDSDIMTHADIEIDDGGTYMVESYEFNDAGALVKTVTEYDAAVSDVNSCKIYDKDGNRLIFAPDYAAVAEEKRNAGKPVEYVKADYFKHGSPGEPQFELTANYVTAEKRDESYSGCGFIGDVEIFLRGNKNFLLKDADRTDFNVDLQLKPIARTVEIFDSSGNSSGPQAAPFTQTTELRSGLQFQLDRQAVMDAYNKCPVHTGLDFTLAANAVMLSFQMKKTFIGGDLSQKHFTFHLLDENGNSAATAKSSDTGILSFSNLYFDKPGTYIYTVQEEPDGSADIRYAEARQITVTVTESGGRLTASADIAALCEPLENHKSYTLPETGGSGTAPFAVIGFSMIAGAVLLTVRHRRKEHA